MGREENDKAEDVKRENKKIKREKVAGSFQDFGANSSIWSQGFLNYLTVLVAFYCQQSPNLHEALMKFYNNIIGLAEVYKWQEAVLPLAIDFHTEVTLRTPTHSAEWNIPRETVGEYCSPSYVLEVAKPQNRSANHLDRGSGSQRRPKEANDKSVICKGFNSSAGCSFVNCKREHKCSLCESMAHSAVVCKERH